MGKLRKERRKEARTEKNQNKFQSWIENQKAQKLKRDSRRPALKSVKTPRRLLVDLSENEEETKPVGKREKVQKKPIAVKNPEHKLSSLGDGDSSLSVCGNINKEVERKPTTKFEEFLQLNMQNNNASAKEDLEFERKLAKKLNINKNKLRGVDDGMNSLFEGIPSVIDSAEEWKVPEDKKFSTKKRKEKKISYQGPENESEFDVDETHDLAAVSEEEEEAKSSSRKRRKRRKSSNKKPESGAVGEEDIEVSTDICGADVAPEEVHVKEPAVVAKGVYIAPHLRSRARYDSEEYTQFRRRVKGLLNRLSEANVESITAELSSIYRSVTRNVASEIISEEILASCSGGPRGNEQYAAIFAALVAGMACSVGIDFGARLIASLSGMFEEEYLKKDNISLRNLTLLLSFLCIFEVCSSDLILDFLIMLGKRLLEVDVSTILTILQCCGMKLRSDDPVAMKNFIVSVQSRVNELKGHEDAQGKIDNKRMEFMLETICEIKNNKKRAKDDSAQHTRVKKWLQKLKVEDILIRGLTWSMLLEPDKKGQWWFAGETTISTANEVEEVAGTIDKEVLETQKMLQLASGQGMNTNSRKAIFCIIMSADDYVDAFEKLLRLDLPGKQDREIMRVLVYCCLREQVFNKYYTVLASKFCNYDKNHKFTLQYCLWDHFKELESMPTIRSMNLARFFSEMLASFTLSLAVLKVVDFTDSSQLTPKRIMHFRMLFEAIFENSDALIWNVFTRAAVSPELEPLRDGIEYFIKTHVESSGKDSGKMFKLAKKALNNVGGVLM